MAQTGFAQLSAARLAVAQINDTGGVLGKPLKLVYRDDGTDPNKAQRSTDALLAEQVAVVIGTVSSALTIQATQAFRSHAVVLSGSATAPGLSTLPDDGYLFRTCASDAGEGRLLAKRARGHNLKRAAIIHRSGLLEAGLAEAFQSAFARGDGQVLVARPYAASQETYVNLLREVLGADPDLLIVLDADPVDGAQIVRDALAHFPGTGVTWVFSHAQQNPAFVEGVGATTSPSPTSARARGRPPAAASWRSSGRLRAALRRAAGARARSARTCRTRSFLAALAPGVRGARAPASPPRQLAATGVARRGAALGADEYGAAVRLHQAAAHGRQLRGRLRLGRPIDPQRRHLRPLRRVGGAERAHRAHRARGVSGRLKRRLREAALRP